MNNNLMTAQQIELGLNQLFEALDVATDEAGLCSDAHDDADLAHKMAYSHAILDADASSAEKREAQAFLACIEEEKLRRTTLRALKAQRDLLAKYEEQRGILQTLSHITGGV